MSLRKKKLLRRIIIGFFLVITSLLLFRLAYFLVDRSNEGKVEEIESEQEITEVIKDVSDDGTIPLYDYDRVGTSVRLEGSEGYDTVVNQIEMVVERVFLNITDIPYDYSNMKLIGLLKNSEIGFISKDFLNDGYTSFFIENSLTVIGMMDNRYIITVWDYPINSSKEIIVIDYENIEVYQEQESILELGDILSVKGCVGQYETMSLSGFNVMFLKG